MATKLLSNAASLERYEKQGRTKVLERVIDFSVVANQCAQNDVLEAIPVRANSYVHAVRAEVLTVEGAARNFQVGDGASTAGWIAAQSANALADFSSQPALVEGTPNTVAPVYGLGKFYTAADTLDVLAPSAGGLVGCKLKVSAIVTEFD